MSSIPTKILLLLLLLILNGAFVLAEIAVISSRKARLQQQANEGNRRAGAALVLAKAPNDFLATVQLGVTLINILIGAISESTFSASLTGLLSRWSLTYPSARSLATVIVVILITALTLLVGELIPKRLALHGPERAAAVMAGPMAFLARLFGPLVWLLGRITDLTLKLFGVKPSTEPSITEEEIHLLIDQGTDAGVIEESEQDMVEGVFKLGDSRVYSLMTPRSDITWLDIKDPPDEIRRKISECTYSRFPVCQGSLDTVVGIVKARDLLVPPGLASPEFRLRDRLKPAFYIPETMFASHALEIFKQKPLELMLVIDEFGSLQGLITLDDIVEEIVGDIEVEAQALQRQDGSWLLDGLLPVDDFKEIFKVEQLPHEA